MWQIGKGTGRGLRGKWSHSAGGGASRSTPLVTKLLNGFIDDLLEDIQVFGMNLFNLQNKR